MNLARLFIFAIIYTGFTLQTTAFGQSPKPAKQSVVPPKPISAKSEPTPAKKSLAETVSAKSDLPSETPADSISKSTDANVYKLVYKLRADEKIVSEVIHLATTNTKMSDVTQASQSRTVSSKVWEVKSIDADGNMTFSQSVASVDMSQQIGDEPEVRYNSVKDEAAPTQFQSVADSIGKPLATITITPWGEVVDRSEKANGTNLGMGDITIPMPKDAIAIGQQWETPREIRVRRTDGSPKMIKVRELYTLEKVSSGVAVIRVRSEPLTPLHEPELEAQAIQQMSDGEVRFDLDAGRLISKSLAWDKTVVGFSGPGSVMDYSARLDEKVQ